MLSYYILIIVLAKIVSNHEDNGYKKHHMYNKNEILLLPCPTFSSIYLCVGNTY